MESTIDGISASGSPPPVAAQALGAGGLFAVVGPLVLGATAGIGFGVRGMLLAAALLPLLVIGLTVAMTPALHIALSLSGGGLSASVLVNAVVRGLASCGLAMAGLSPALLFLVTTSSSPETMAWLMLGGVAACVCVGLRALAGSLFEGRVVGRRVLIFSAWSLVGVALGVDLLESMIKLLMRTP